MTDSELQRAFKNNMIFFGLSVASIAICIMIPGAIGFHKYQQLKQKNCFINETVYPTYYPPPLDDYPTMVAIDDPPPEYHANESYI